MAKKMPFEDAYGNHYEDSYWRLAQLNLGVADRTAMAQFYGYKDKESRDAKKQPIGSRSYSISGDKFDQLMALHLAPNGPNMMQIAYQIATETKDVIVDKDDPSKNESFFEGAEDIL